MFDNLRDNVNSDTFYKDEKKQAQPMTGTAVHATRPKPIKFLGMTAQQRFIIAFMMLIAVCVLGIMLLLITEKIGLY
jgi:hypothetical protein